MKIVLPEGADIKCANGTKCFTETGEEIKNVTKIEFGDIEIDSIIEAKITVAVTSIENLERILACAEIDDSFLVEGDELYREVLAEYKESLKLLEELEGIDSDEQQ